VHHFIEQYGLLLLFLLVMMESSGIPVPGETALITAAFFAQQGRFNIGAVIAVAAAAAIVGDNIGYWLGRKGGRRLLMRWGPLARYAERALPRGEAFFARHGGKTVFLARFVAVLRIFGAWIAGMTKMPWRWFLLWNAVGGICWAVLFGLSAYFFSQAAVEAVARWGTIGGLLVVVVGVVAFLGIRALERRR
jgi:membrane protein DedA with SNARE-associated domain